MDALLKLLNGKKTHVIAAIAVILVLLEKFAGLDIPGFDVGDDWLGFILAALGASTLRAGIAKSGPIV